MAVTKLESLVLRGKFVTSNVVAGTMHVDSITAKPQAPESMSQGRLMSSSSLRAVYPAASRWCLVDDLDQNPTGIRAGRSGSFVGVLVHRSPALHAGVVHVVGVARPTAAERLAFVGHEFTERSLLLAKQSKREKAKAAWSMPRGRTLPASTWGIGSR